MSIFDNSHNVVLCASEKRGGPAKVVRSGTLNGKGCGRQCDTTVGLGAVRSTNYLVGQACEPGFSSSKIWSQGRESCQCLLEAVARGGKTKQQSIFATIQKEEVGDRAECRGSPPRGPGLEAYHLKLQCSANGNEKLSSKTIRKTTDQPTEDSMMRFGTGPNQERGFNNVGRTRSSLRR